MSLEEQCLSLNDTLLEGFAKSLNITKTELQNLLKTASRNDKVLDMTNKVNVAFKNNPNIVVNFGDYGQRVADEAKLNSEYMYQAIVVTAQNDLLLNIATQLNNIYKR